MSKEVQLSINIERDLLDEFSQAAAAARRPAPQIMRELMRGFISRTREPNEESLAAMREIDSGGGTEVKDVEDMFRECGV